MQKRTQYSVKVLERPKFEAQTIDHTGRFQRKTDYYESGKVSQPVHILYKRAYTRAV